MDELLKPMTDETISFVDRCRDFLESRWKAIAAAVESGERVDPLLPTDADLRDQIEVCLTSQTKSYRYVLPTQVLCKCVDPSLDSHSIQAGYGERGAFDARTVAHKVIVPFDQENHRVLGGSPEPYVNNPLRCPAVTAQYRSQQKNKSDWDRLVAVLDSIEDRNTADLTQRVFDQILIEIHRLLRSVQVLYPTPNRVSLAQTVAIIDAFTRIRSGGDRVEAVCTALFRVIASQFHLFDEVRRQKVNAADAASFVSGQNIHVSNFLDLSNGILILLGEKGRVQLLSMVGEELDRAGSDIVHRRAWANLLRSV